MTQPVDCLENAKVPSWVAVRPRPILISGKWYEIDTIEDLQRAEEEIN